MEEKQKDYKKWFIVAGLFLLILAIIGGNLKYINNWSTAELVGYNLFGVFELFGGIYLIYKGVKK